MTLTDITRVVISSANLFFEMPARDPLTLASVAATLLLVALAACDLPAARATRISPTLALRAE